ncbi:IS4/Tn5 family transposase DNA-binding protein, partial [Paraburkholderia aspalathi]
MARKTSWADEELEGIDLGDERRNDRAKRVLMRFAEKPTQSIVGASQGWP